MMRTTYLSAMMLALTAPTAIHAEAAPKFTTASTTINDLIANPEAKAVLVKHLPQIVEGAPMIGGQTLKQVQSMAPDRLTDKMLADIDADLAKIK